MVVIEGFVETVPHFVASVRARNPSVVVLYLCLDSFPSAHRALRVDVDAYITNSAHLHSHVLSLYAPTVFLPLAVDDRFARLPAAARYRYAALLLIPTSQQLGDVFALHVAGLMRVCRHDVVYVGQNSQLKDNLYGAAVWPMFVTAPFTHVSVFG